MTVTRLAIAAPLLLFLVMVGLLARGLFLEPSVLPSALLDRPAPAFALEPVPGYGEGVTQADLTGQVRLLNVFASWCGPCRVEHPLLMDLADEVPIVGIAHRDQPQDAAAFLRELGNPYVATGLDLDRRVSIDFGVYGVPETFVIDAAGTIRHKHVGPLTEADVDGVIRPLIRHLRDVPPAAAVGEAGS